VWGRFLAGFLRGIGSPVTHEAAVLGCGHAAHVHRAGQRLRDFDLDAVRKFARPAKTAWYVVVVGAGLAGLTAPAP